MKKTNPLEMAVVVQNSNQERRVISVCGVCMRFAHFVSRQTSFSVFVYLVQCRSLLGKHLIISKFYIQRPLKIERKNEFFSGDLNGTAGKLQVSIISVTVTCTCMVRIGRINSSTARIMLVLPHSQLFI